MSGGYPADIVYSMSLVSLNGAAGAAGAAGASGTQNEVPSNHTAYGFKSQGVNGVLRFHEFKTKLRKVFHFNQEVGCIFTADFRSTIASEFFDELYLSYLMVFKTNPSELNATNPRELHDALFNAQSHYMWFKVFILAPNLKYNGFFGFPSNIGIQPAAETWLKA
jgi:hypothetical protein